MTHTTMIGVGYRRRLRDQILASDAAIECLEVLVEHFLPLTDARINELALLRERFRLIPHGVGLSVGSKSVLEYPHATDLKRLLKYMDAPFFGEHMSVSRAAGYDIWHLSPVWRSEEQLERVIFNVQSTSEFLEIPMAIETITEPFLYSASEYRTDEFYAEVAARADAALLVDVTNIWINEANDVSDIEPAPFGLLAEARWRQLHIVGYSRDADGFYVDSHDQPIQDEIFEVLRQSLTMQAPEFVIIERDGGFHEAPLISDEVAKIRSMLPSTALAH